MHIEGLREIAWKIKSAGCNKAEGTHTYTQFMMAAHKTQAHPVVAGLIQGFLQGPTTWAQAAEGDSVSPNHLLRILFS